MEPFRLLATELSALYGAGELSPVEAMRSVLARAEAWGGNGLYLTAPERALGEAEASEARWRRGEPLSALDGVPVTVKDNIRTKGEPSPLGTAASLGEPGADDSPPAARLREAGAILFAKTTMPDYGMTSSGLSSLHALTRNPWDSTRNPGGSSSGAAAAAAAQIGPIHVGTDIGGSIRLPAGWCGTVGFKPSFGRVPIDPTYLGRAAGPLTRSLDDCALAMAALSKPDLRDAMSLPPQTLDWRIAPASLEGVKIGLWLDAGCGAASASAVRAAVQATALRLMAEGAIIEPVKPFLTPEFLRGFDRFYRMRSWADVKELPPERREKILPFVRQWVEGAADYSADEVFDGVSRLHALRAVLTGALAGVDYLIAPTAPMTAFSATESAPSGDPADPFGHIGFTFAFNVGEQPAISLNCGFDAEGLPIGLQIVGRRFDDLGALRLAKALEGLLAGQSRPWPEPFPKL